MKNKFSLFCSHIDLAHKMWKELVKPGDKVIDATCGNGQDTKVLAKLALTEDSGEIFAIDIQHSAIESSKKALSQEFSQELMARIFFFERCHATFPEHILPQSIKLIVYNLGYLPGGNKTLTTESDTSLKSIINAQNLLQEGGLISVTCYPGHESGKYEEAKILEYITSLDPKIWSCSHNRWINRKNSPSLALIQKSSGG